MDAVSNSADAPRRRMNADSKRRSLVEAINAGIASRDFYIVPSANEIPGCSGNTKANLECARRFALDNGWHVTAHDGNGWFLFTANEPPAIKNVEADLEQLLKLLEFSLRGSRPEPEALPPRWNSRPMWQIRPRYGN